MFTDPGTELHKLPDGSWTNGHLRFDPDNGFSFKKWMVRLATSNVSAEPLGHIRWHGLWKQYTFRPYMVGYPLGPECLEDIAKFCREQNK